jgi:tRNA-dihydrouridine synthase
VHARTVEQKYLGPSKWEFLRWVKSRWPGRTILGSGDVFTAEDVVRMLRETGVDIVWIARGAIGNPWIFTHAAQLLAAERAVGTHGRASLPASEIIRPPTIHEQRDALAEHFSIAMQIHGEQLAGRRMRKMGIQYSRFHPDAAAVKTRFIDVRCLRDWTAVLDDHYAADGPGVCPAPTAADEVNESPDMQTCESGA